MTERLVTSAILAALRAFWTLFFPAALAVLLARAALDGLRS